MDLATANTVGNSSTAFVTTRNTGIGVQGAQTQNLSQSGAAAQGTKTPSQQAEAAVDNKDLSPYVARYPTVAFSFNEDASRLIMLFRDPDTGRTVSQIPSEVVVKQYKEAQLSQRKADGSNLQVVIGDAATSKAGSANGASSAGGAASSQSSIVGSALNGPAGAGPNGNASNASAQSGGAVGNGALGAAILASTIGTSGGILLAASGVGAASSGGNVSGGGSTGSTGGAVSSGGGSSGSSGAASTATSSGGSGGGSASVNVVV